MVPDFDGAVRAAGDEDLRVEGVPLDSVHRHGVGVVRLQELAGVRFGALTTKRPSQDWSEKKTMQTEARPALHVLAKNIYDPREARRGISLVFFFM